MRKALVIGGGIAGLSSAISLRQGGWSVDVVEINRTRDVYHVGIIVQSNFLRALDRLGVAEEAIARGYPYAGFDLCALDGSLDAYIPGVELSRKGHPTDLGLTRPALHDILMGAATKWDVTPRYNVTFNKIEQVGDKVNLSFTDGTNDCYDMVVGADGLYSKTRTTVFDAALLPQYTGQAVWRYNLPRPADVVRTALFQGASGGKAGYCPLNDDTMYLLLVMREPGNPWIPRNQLAAAFTDRLKQFGGRIAHIRDTVEFDPDKIVYRPLEAILVPAPWYRGGVLLIGDAAHGTTPHLGQGAAQAVEDAVVLGAIAAGDLAVADIVRQFMERRYARCKLIWESSLQIGRWEIDDDPDADVPAISRAVLQSLSQDI